jgi:hypothetical protein
VQALESKQTCYTETNCPSYSCDPSYNTAFRIGAEALYWKAAESGLANLTKATLHPANITGGRTKHPRFNWHWGFRLDAGYNICHDLWDVYASWTRYHIKDRRSFTLGESRDPATPELPILAPFWVLASVSVPVNDAEWRWKVNLDLIDLQIGREFYASTFLSLKPHVGLVVGWIHQTNNLHYESETTAVIDPAPGARVFSIHMQNNFWGIGIIGGVDTKWELGCGFSIYGNGSMAALDGHFHTTYDIFSTEDGAPFTDYDTINHQNMANFVAHLALGMRWERSFACDRFNTSIWMGYEQNIFFEQNQFMNLQFDSSLYNPCFYTDGGSLNITGLVVGADLRF